MLSHTPVLKFDFVSWSGSVVQIAVKVFFCLLLELSFANTPLCLATVVTAVVGLSGVQSVTSRSAVYHLAVDLVLA